MSWLLPLYHILPYGLSPFPACSASKSYKDAWDLWHTLSPEERDIRLPAALMNNLGALLIRTGQLDEALRLAHASLEGAGAVMHRLCKIPL